MHNESDVYRALTLKRLGFAINQIADRVAIPKRTIRDWISGRIPNFENRISNHEQCNSDCREASLKESQTYLYLLGLYLGDGCLTKMKRSVFKLRIVCCNDYPSLIKRCEHAISTVMPCNRVGLLAFSGYTEVYSYSKHWPCLFPQHGVGKKHDRVIELKTWQQKLVDLDPRPLVEGLLHSDGCRVTNVAINKKSGKRYEYPRYHFSQRSPDIKKIFTNALDQLGIAWKYNNAMNVSIAKKESVAALDSFVAPKS